MFKFRLQRVLDLRQRTERDAATALVSAQETADAARDAQRRVEEARQALASTITTGMAATDAPLAGASSVGALRNLSFLLERLDERVAGAAAEANAAAQVVQQREDTLRAAYRERRTLDRLRERHHEQWRTTEAEKDRVLMDEIALTRFTQAGSAPSANAGSADADREP